MRTKNTGHPSASSVGVETKHPESSQFTATFVTAASAVGSSSSESEKIHVPHIHKESAGSMSSESLITQAIHLTSPISRDQMLTQSEDVDGQPITIHGDMHASLLKLIQTQRLVGVIINSDEEYGQILEEVRQVCMTHSPLIQSREELIAGREKLLAAIARIRISTEVKQVFGGDMFADRGENDDYIRAYIQHAILQGLQIEIMASNHDIEALNAYERIFNSRRNLKITSYDIAVLDDGRILSGLEVDNNTLPDYDRSKIKNFRYTESLKNWGVLRTKLEGYRDPVVGKSVDESMQSFYNEVLLKAINIIKPGFICQDGEYKLIFSTHAPVVEQDIQILFARYRLSDGRSLDKMSLIEIYNKMVEANEAFKRELMLSIERQTFIQTVLLDPNYPNSLSGFLHNRNDDLGTREGAYQYHVTKRQDLVNVHGHIGEVEDKKSILSGILHVCLDSNIGRSQFIDNMGNVYPAIDTGNVHLYNTKLQHNLDYIKTTSAGNVPDFRIALSPSQEASSTGDSARGSSCESDGSLAVVGDRDKPEIRRTFGVALQTMGMFRVTMKGGDRNVSGNKRQRGREDENYFDGSFDSHAATASADPLLCHEALGGDPLLCLESLGDDNERPRKMPRL